MIRTETVNEPTEVVVEVRCNRCRTEITQQCGRSVVVPKKIQSSYEGLFASFGCGYGSDIYDGAYFEFTLCERCVSALILSFSIPPTVGGSEVFHWGDPEDTDPKEVAGNMGGTILTADIRKALVRAAGGLKVNWSDD